MLIGLVGRKGSGKSTLARMLVERGFSRQPLAGPLKAMLRALLYQQGVDHDLVEEMIDGALKETPSALLGGKTPRHCMQTLGTEWGRDLIAPTFWLDVWTERVRGTDRVVCDDVRFLNEAQRVRRLGGWIVRVTRSDLPASVDPHPSEIEMESIVVDHEIINPEGAPHDMIAQLLQRGIAV